MIIGGIISIVNGILAFLGYYFGMFWLFGGTIISCIALILLGSFCFYLNAKLKDPMHFNWIFLLVVAILILTFGSLIGGFLVLIAAVIGILIEE